MFATTPEAPYFAVIFTSVKTEAEPEGYAQMAGEMERLAATMPGYLGIEHAGSGVEGITVSYWRTLEDVAGWRRKAEHVAAQRAGREKWYQGYRVRVAKVERAYAFP